MSVKNNWFTGLLVGMAVPALAWYIFDVQFPGLSIRYKPGVPYLIAVAINLIIIRFCLKNDAENTGRGIMLATFVCMVLIFLFKIKH